MHLICTKMNAKHIVVSLFVCLGVAQVLPAQVPEERRDSLDAAVLSGRRQGNYISRLKPLKVEVISSDGLQKMACCNVAESFENSASVTVGYSDAVTGARQIRLLGLSGVYTQMLDESRPVMRGIAAPFGLTYMPGQWLESIQIAKGAASVTSGVESVTGQINLEHRKPTDEKPLFLSLTGMSDSRFSGDVASSLQLSDRLSTVILGHADANFRHFDMNRDGFMDDPMVRQFNLANRWLWYNPRFQFRFGVNAVMDDRTGGQPGYDRRSYSAGRPWGSEIGNLLFGAYLKLGVPLRDDQSSSVALVADYTSQQMDAFFGDASYLARQHSAYLNLIWRNRMDEHNDFTVGASGIFDHIDEVLDRGANAFSGVTPLSDVSIYGEYTLHLHEAFTAVAGAGIHSYGGQGLRFVPRATLKFQPVDMLVLRLNGGRGLRTAMPLTDNIGVFSTGKAWTGNYEGHLLEDAWTWGGSATLYLPFGADPDNSYLSFDYFHTAFGQQLIVDYERFTGGIDFYASAGTPSYTDTFQADFFAEPFRGFTVNMTARYTDALVSLQGKGLVERPMTPRFKGVLNLQYKAGLSRWIFDFTAAINGSCRAYDFMDMPNGRTPVYPMLYAQVTRRFKGLDVFVGAENLTGFRQKTVILGVPGSPSFDASAVWGPLMGFRADAGIRITLWKTC